MGIKIINWFVWNNYPWFLRGSGVDRGSIAGVFAFSNDYGTTHGARSFRVVSLIL